MKLEFFVFRSEVHINLSDKKNNAFKMNQEVFDPLLNLPIYRITQA